MTTQPVYMITAAAGNIGKRLVAHLLSLPSKPHVVLPTSNASKLRSSLPEALDNARIHIVEGSIKDPRFVEAILRKHNVTGVSLALTGDDELFTTTNILDAIQRSGTVKHLIYISACEDYSLDAIKNGSLQGQSAAHVLVKYLVEAKIRHGLPPRAAPGGLSWTILGPSLFFDNDFMMKQQLLDHGIFGVPLGDKGVSRVDPADIALAAANSLEDDGLVWGGKKVMIGSLKTYTGGDIAQLWARALGKDIKPTLADQEGLDSLENGFGQVAGPAWGRDLRLMYETFAQRGFLMSEADYKEQVKLLGKEPESYEKFVELTAKEWTTR
ncbi:hypothetical protein E8E11_009374 [Didymella keratinophila]|nr:hypothetical protein E8E11_009374 [Didymella keratinophila]